MRRKDDEQGAALIEMVIVLIFIFLPLLWAIITFGYVFSVRENMTHSAQEAMRAAVLEYQANNSQTQVGCDAVINARGRMSAILGSHDAPATDDTYNDSTCSGDTPANSNGGLNINYSYAPCTDGSGNVIYETGSPSTASTCLTMRLSYEYGNFPIVSSIGNIFNIIPSTINVTATQRVA